MVIAVYDTGQANTLLSVTDAVALVAPGLPQTIKTAQFPALTLAMLETQQWDRNSQTFVPRVLPTPTPTQASMDALVVKPFATWTATDVSQGLQLVLRHMRELE